MILCKELFGRNYFQSYSEFYLMLVIAKECLRRGTYLDITGMYIEKDVTPDNILEYYKILVNRGAIVINTSVKSDADNGIHASDLDMDTSCFGELEGKLYKEYEEYYEWTFEYALDAYSLYANTLMNNSQMGNILMHIVGYHIASSILGYISNKPLRIVIDDKQKVNSTYIYINLLSCSKTLPMFEKRVELDIDFSEFKIDLDYSIFCNNGIVAKRNKLYSMQEKEELLKQEGIVENSIMVLWERKGMCVSNPIGRIVNCTLVRIEEICREYIYVTCLPLIKTKEEIIDDYYSIPEDKRFAFSDMLNFKLTTYTNNIPMTSLGVRNYFSTVESFFIDKLDSYSKVSKKVTVDGVSDYVEMSEIDAIYWLLCQYEVEFDKKLFKNIYNFGKDLLWDKYGKVE